MAVWLKRALMEILTDWPDDLPPEWRDACSEAEIVPACRSARTCYGHSREWLRANAMAIFYPVGTCKMGNDDMAVLDARPKVRSVDRLRVADASAMPIMSNGNINAPSIIIGGKCAGFILEEAA
jgi:choline dehydrogenase-like flavoprotein